MLANLVQAISQAPRSAQKLLSVWLIMLLGACASSDHVSDTPQIVSDSDLTLQIDNRQYVGSFDTQTNTVALLGIPFAEAPVGDLRWQAPQEYRNLSTVAETVEATAFMPACQQADRIINWYQDVIADFGGDPGSFPVPQFSEDCLYLNIWAPKDAKDLPVYVYVHGGANKAGWSYEPNYIGAQMASKGAVVVSIAYRVGVFGFFAHPELADANFGLLDQIESLRWIQQHIDKVGGDPKNVTVAGESAGADNIAVLLGSPLSTGLFDHAVVQSGGWSIQAMPDKADYYELANQLMQKVVPENETLAALKDISAAELVEAAEEVYVGHYFNAMVDASSMPRALGEVAASNELNPVDLIVGSNTNEYLVYLDESETVQAWMDSQSIAAERQGQLRGLLNQSATELEQLDELVTAAEFGCPALALAEAVTANGYRVWVYDFNKVRRGELAEKMGAYHGAELPYVFNTHDDWLPTDEADIALTQQIQAYWLNFAKRGDPNARALELWSQFDQESRTAQSLGLEVKTKPHPSIALCDLLAELSAEAL
ncbi:MAG: carboxylesterase family protein [Pseudomonadota bacterium]